MKQTLLVLFSFTFLVLQAQVTVSKGNVTSDSSISEESMVLETIVKNENDDNVKVWWSLDTDNFPEAWDYQVCDMNTCYDFNMKVSPSANPNVFTSGQTWPFTIRAKHNGEPGSGFITTNLVNEHGHQLAHAVMDFNFSPVQTDKDTFSGDLSIYPNPTTDLFRIRNDHNVAKIAVYNVVGKTLFNYNHISGKNYDVSNLQKGLYLVRLFDENDIVLSVIRLNKH